MVHTIRGEDTPTPYQRCLEDVPSHDWWRRSKVPSSSAGPVARDLGGGGTKDSGRDRRRGRRRTLTRHTGHRTVGVGAYPQLCRRKRGRPDTGGRTDVDLTVSLHPSPTPNSPYPQGTSAAVGPGSGPSRQYLTTTALGPSPRRSSLRRKSRVGTET